MNRLFRPIYHLFLILVLFTISFCIGISQITPIYAATGINQVINFQGKVVNSDGTNVTDGTYDFVFKLYDGASSGAANTFTESWTSAALFSSTMSSAPTSGGESLTYSSNTNESTLKVGQILWNTTKGEAVVITSVNTGTNVLGISPTAQAWANSDTITNKIYVKDGVFHVNINSLNQDLSAVDFNTDNIFVGLNFNANGEMKPRIQFTSTPYAMNARKVSGLTVTDTTGTFTLANSKTFKVDNTLTLSGTDGTGFTFPSGSGLVVTTDSTATLTNKTIGSTGLTFSGASTDITTGTNENLAIMPNGTGKVGIGTTAPGAKLHVLGNGTYSALFTSGNVGIGTTAPGYALEVAGDIKIGDSGSTISRLILGSSSADGTGANGAMIYNTATNKFRCYQNGGWTDCIGGGTSLSFTNGLTSTSSTVTLGGTLTQNTTLSDGGFNLLFAGSTGKMGVGTTSPAAKLHVAGNNTTSAVFMSGNVGIGTTLPGSLFELVDTGTTTNSFNLTSNSITTGIALNMNLNSLTSGKGLYIGSTSTALTTGNLINVDWSPTATTTATGDLMVIGIGSSGNIGNIFNIKDSGSSLFSVSESQVTSNLPASFNAAGDTSFAYDISLTNEVASYIKSNGPMYIQAGDSYESNDLTLRTYNAGNLAIDLTGTGSAVQITGTDTSLVFDTRTAGDTDYWMGIQDNANSTDDDLFMIGKSLTSGSSPFVVINTNGNVGIGTTAPGAKLQVVGNGTRAAIFTSGNVGIGTTAPGYALEVSGDIKIGDSGSTIPRLILGSSSADGTAANGAMIYNTSTNKFRCYQNGGWTDCIGTGGPGTSYSFTNGLTSTSSTVTLGGALTANTTLSDGGFNLLFAGSTGKMGVGTTAPGAKLHVAGNNTTSAVFMAGNVGIGTTAPGSLLELVDTGTTTNSFNLTSNSITTGIALNMNLNSLTSGKGLYIGSTSTALTTGNLINVDWSPTATTNATGDLIVIGIGSSGNIGNIFNIKDSGNSLFSVSETQITSALPHAFTAAGDVSVAYDMLFTNQTSSYIKSNGPLYIESGEAFENNNLTLKTYGSGNLLVDLTGTGSAVRITGTDTSLKFDTRTAGDTDYWMGVQDDAGGDDDDKLMIGKSLTGGSIPFMTFDVNGNVGVATTTPNYKLEVSGDIKIGDSGSTIPRLILGSSSADGTAANGAMIYNTTTNKFRCYQNGGWTDCIGTGGPGTSYSFTNGLTSTSSTVTLGGALTGDTTLSDAGFNLYFAGSTGKLGVGTTAPGAKLHVEGNGTYSALFMSGNVGIEVTAPSEALDLGGASANMTFSNATGPHQIKTGGSTHLVLMPGGNVGINTTSPGAKLHVVGNGTNSAVFMTGNVGIGTTLPAHNTSIVGSLASNQYVLNVSNLTSTNATTTRLLRLSVGSATGAGQTLARFVHFVAGGTTESNGTIIGRIRQNNAAVLYDTTGADFAEYFDVIGPVQTGDIIATSKDGNVIARENQPLLGVASDASGFVGNAKGENPEGYIVGLLGQIYTKVSTINGPIHKGDNITSSSITGMGKKMTQPGYTIGRALEDFDPDHGVGQRNDCPSGTASGVTCGAVKVMVSASWYDPRAFITEDGNVNGVSENALNFPIPSYITNSKTEKLVVSGGKASAKKIIDMLKSGFNESEDSSKLFTFSPDKITAGLEITSPHVSTELLSVRTIESLDQSDIALNLSKDGKFVIKNAAGESVVTIDDQGNAFFNGLVTAKGIKADQIEGIQFLTSRIDKLEQAVASSSAQTVATDSAVLGANTASAEASLSPDVSYIDSLNASVSALLAYNPDWLEPTISTDVARLHGLTVENDATVSGQLHINGSSLIEGVLNVITTITTHNFIATGWTDFMGSVIFRGNVGFSKAPKFSPETAGTAIVKKGTDTITVKFTKQYEDVPVINATIALSSSPDEDNAALEKLILSGDVRYIIVNKTTKGFSIKLNKKAATDIEFSWMALAVKEQLVIPEVSISPAEPVSSSSSTLSNMDH